jgi:glycosyltransferase involved in cell wall biosynthesis
MAEAPEIAVIVPCFNEAPTVAKVVTDFARALPGATVYVFDNNSTDDTAANARAAGAQVIHSPRQGKGNVFRHMSTVVDADIYVIVDGDDTYSAEAAPRLIDRFLESSADMLVATRLDEYEAGSFRVFHLLGNQLVSRLVSILFSTCVTDILSGYRILSRDFVRLVRLRTGGFELETEMTLQALTKKFTIVDVPVPYCERPTGSVSKLATWSDGYLILQCIMLILKDYKPLLFFSVVALLLVVASLVSGIRPIIDFYETGLVLRIPRVILASGLAILAALSFLVGLVLDTIAKYHQESIEMWKELLTGMDRDRSSRGSVPGRD